MLILSAISKHRIRWRFILPGLSVLVFLLLFYFLSLQQLVNVKGNYSWQPFWQDSYLHHVIRFSVLQALLSAVLSIFIGLLAARAFYYQSFYGKKFLLKIFSLTFVLPSLVVIFGLIGIYGSQGWLAGIINLFTTAWMPNIYGLSGIIIAHLFFNMPLACNVIIQALGVIPVQQRQLAAQLGIRGWQFIRLVELPFLRQSLLSLFVLIFMLCFTSFAIVLTLGGGPRYTTLEVAIYQAITFEFDLPKAAMIAIIQLLFCVSLFLISNFFHDRTYARQIGNVWQAKQSVTVKIIHMIIITLVSLFILFPLFNILYTGIFNTQILYFWQNKEFWLALGYSLVIAPCAATISIVLTFSLLLSARYLYWLAYWRIANIFVNLSMVVLAIPTLVIAIGLFLLLQQYSSNTFLLFAVVVFCNALIAMPFVLKILKPPFYNNMQRYENLSNSLGIRGWQRFRLIEWHYLKSPLNYAFAIATALSLGDFTAIALFGNQNFTSLPRLLYQQLGHYHTQDAAVTTLVLLVLCLAIFGFIESNKPSKVGQQGEGDDKG